METIQILVLALVQGLTEFLPISSSAHLILAPLLFGFGDQGLAFDVAVHVGSLGAVIWYFRKDLVPIVSDTLGNLIGKTQTQDSRLGWALVVGTIPVVIVGLLLKGLVETDLRSPLVIAITTIGFGLLLLWADRTATRRRDEHSLSWRDVWIIGAFQAVALIPGTSRSGITMTAGLMLGLTRAAASRFSFLLSIPTILMSGGLVTLDLIQQGNPVAWSELLTGIVLSFVAAYACIHFFLRFIERIGMLPFVIYRLLLGTVIFVLISR
jgi:undecaprenyl-diphosphatase